jgi:myo-inositol-1(or 4)-monophosphatase
MSGNGSKQSGRVVDERETQEALTVAREAAGQAIEGLKDALDRTGPEQAHRKRPRDFVTEADRLAEERILEHLLDAFPDHTVVAEESGRVDRDGAFSWVVDPLDGTTNFVHGFPVFSVSIALFEGSDPVVGLVADATRGEWFSARVEQGAHLDHGDPRESRRLEVARPDDRQSALLATGFPFRQPEELDRYLAAFRALFDQVSDMRRAGSAALDLAYVAAGRVDGFWEIGLSLWDIAAGEILVTEAGGRVTDWRGGKDHRRTGWVAAGSPSVHEWLVEALTGFAAEQETSI